MVECFNRTFETMLRKYPAEFSTQCDRYSLWVYYNLTHDSTGEKPLFQQLYGLDCRSQTEDALLPAHAIEPTEVKTAMCCIYYKEKIC